MQPHIAAARAKHRRCERTALAMFLAALGVAALLMAVVVSGIEWEWMVALGIGPAGRVAVLVVSWGLVLVLIGRALWKMSWRRR